MNRPTHWTTAMHQPVRFAQTSLEMQWMGKIVFTRTPLGGKKLDVIGRNILDGDLRDMLK